MMQFDCVYKCIQCLYVYLLLFKKQSKMTFFFLLKILTCLPQWCLKENPRMFPIELASVQKKNRINAVTLCALPQVCKYTSC